MTALRGELLLCRQALADGHHDSLERVVGDEILRREALIEGEVIAVSGACLFDLHTSAPETATEDIPSLRLAAARRPLNSSTT